MTLRPPPRFEIGTRVRAPCILISEDVRRLHVGTVTSYRWDDEEGWGRKAGWAYGITLDAGGGCRADEGDLEPLGVVDRLADIVRGVDRG